MQVVGSDSPEVQLRFIAVKPGKGETKVSTELTQQLLPTVASSAGSMVLACERPRAGLGGRGEAASPPALLLGLKQHRALTA